MRGLLLPLLAACAALLAPARAPAADLLALGGAAKTKYLAFDPETHSLFIAHGDEITIVDTHGFAIRGHVPAPGGVHGVAIAPNLHGYATLGKSATILIFDARDGHVLKTIPAGADANFILYDPASQHIVALNDDADSISIIDPRTDSAVATLSLPGGEGLEAAASDGDFTLYAVHSARAELLRVDLRANRVSGHMSLPDCRKPQGVALDAPARRAFVSCADKLLVLDTGSGKLLSALPAGPGGLSLIHDAARQRLYAANGNATISVFAVAAGQLRKLRDLPSGPGARALAEDAATGRLYSVAAPATLLRIEP